MAGTVVVYGKADCPHTTRARKELFEQRKTVEYRDVVQNPEYLDEMLGYSGGKRVVPVIVEDGKVTVGHNGGG